jgi:hypothetical protein
MTGVLMRAEAVAQETSSTSTLTASRNSAIADRLT